VVEDAPRADEIELGVAERQLLGVRNAQIGLETFSASRSRTAAIDANLQHALFAPTLEVGKRRDEGLQLVSPPLDVGIELGRSRLGGARRRPAPIRLPVARTRSFSVSLTLSP
jgi:hypothetical protein